MEERYKNKRIDYPVLLVAEYCIFVEAFSQTSVKKYRTLIRLDHDIKIKNSTLTIQN